MLTRMQLEIQQDVDTYIILSKPFEMVFNAEIL